MTHYQTKKYTEVVNLPPSYPRIHRIRGIQAIVEIIGIEILEGIPVENYDGKQFNNTQLILRLRVEEKIKYHAKDQEGILYYKKIITFVAIEIDESINAQNIIREIQKRNITLKPQMHHTQWKEIDENAFYQTLYIQIQIDYKNLKEAIPSNFKKGNYEKVIIERTLQLDRHTNRVQSIDDNELIEMGSIGSKSQIEYIQLKNRVLDTRKKLLILGEIRGGLVYTLANRQGSVRQLEYIIPFETSTTLKNKEDEWEIREIRPIAHKILSQMIEDNKIIIFAIIFIKAALK